MRELFFVSNYLGNGGAARVLIELAEMFSKDNFNVTIISYNHDENEYVVPKNISVIYCPIECVSSLDKVKRCFWLRSVFKQHPDACIIAFEYFVNVHVLFALRGLNNKVIVSERNDPAREGCQFPMEQFRKFFYPMADYVVFQTKQAMDYFSNSRHINGKVIINPIKTKLPPPFVGHRSKRIVSFCRLERQKNLKLLIKAFDMFYKDHSDFKLEIYGDGALREELIDYAKSLQSSKAIHIFEGRSDIHEVVRDASMFVLPSDYEGLSNSMLEAMAIGMPVLCSDCPCGGASMVINDGINGFLFKPGDVDMLYHLMTLVADDSRISENLGLNAYKINQRCSIDSVYKIWLNLVKN